MGFFSNLFGKKRKEQLAQQAAQQTLMNMLFEQEYLRKQILIERLNDEYALGLYDGDIYAIARADDPSAALKRLVDPGLPSIEEFKENFSRLLHLITHGIGLSQEGADTAEEDMIELLQDFDEEDIEIFANASSNLMHGDLAFLNGKINYLLCVLGIFASYGKITENDFWIKKADEISKKHGYTHYE